jgi:cytochrome c553
MLKIINQITPRASVLGFAALALVSSLMIGCEKTTETEDGCTGNDSLYICREVLIDTGTAIFAETCTGCHGDAGNGQGHGGPVIANSDYAMGSTERLVVTLLNGVNAPITVNGRSYPGGTMPAWAESFSNTGIAGLATYIRSVLNDSLVTNCVTDPNDPEIITCTKTARTPTDIRNDTVPVWQVKAVRDTLTPPAP